MIKELILNEQKELPYLVIAQGGGFAGIECHCGYLMAIYQIMNDFHDNYLGRGASAGALSLALSMTLGPDRMYDLIKDTNVSDLMYFQSHQILRYFCPFVDVSRLYHREGMYKMIKKNTDISILRNRLVASLTNADTNESLLTNVFSHPVLYGTSAIPIAFEVIRIDFPSESIYAKDGGCKNNIPTIRINDIKKYKHIFILMTPNDKYSKPAWYEGLLHKAITELSSTGLREVDKVLYEWSPKNDEMITKENVTVLQAEPPDFETSVMNWSENKKLVNHCYSYAMAKLEQKSKYLNK